jgi:hypothetical protein
MLRSRRDRRAAAASQQKGERVYAEVGGGGLPEPWEEEDEITPALEREGKLRGRRVG